eukprot:2994762-Pleurochrysis_carterae.AAC.2
MANLLCSTHRCRRIEKAAHRLVARSFDMTSLNAKRKPKETPRAESQGTLRAFAVDGRAVSTHRQVHS